jgi:hypothetical protein
LLKLTKQKSTGGKARRVELVSCQPTNAETLKRIAEMKYLWLVIMHIEEVW